MTALLEPDQAVQKWRDQIEENSRLQHAVADRDARISELAILNHEALFAARHYEAQFEAVKSERDSLQLLATVYRAKLEAFAGVAAEVSRTIANLGEQAGNDANIAPALTQLAAATAPAPAAAASPAIAPTSVDAAVEAMGAAIAPPIAEVPPPAVEPEVSPAPATPAPPAAAPIKTNDAPALGAAPVDVAHATPLPAVVMT